MPDVRCDIVIIGGGLGGCAAALAACSLGMRVLMTEPSPWIGGQATSQGVPADEHPWIEDFGCTGRYRTWRERIRLAVGGERLAVGGERLAGGGWVSRLCVEPRIALTVLREMLAPHVASGHLVILGDTELIECTMAGDAIESAVVRNEQNEQVVHAAFFLDASETGDLIFHSETEHVIGAEAGERNGESQENNQQAITWCMPLSFDPGAGHVIAEPKNYPFWRDYEPPKWPGNLLSWTVPHPQTGEPKTWQLFEEEAGSQWCLWNYRRIVSGERREEVTMVNWPQNDAFLRPHLTSAGVDKLAERDAKELSLSLLYWLQTEAPRPDGGFGYPGLYIKKGIFGSSDGLAWTPYVRESRRILAQQTIREQDVSPLFNPGLSKAPSVKNSIGVAAYRIDLHPTASGVGYIDLGCLPFEIPLASLLPVRMRNLLPACKNIGTTHITNGATRVHPAEWNIGEAAGVIAAYCVERSITLHDLDSYRRGEIAELVAAQGIETSWPDSVHAL